MFLNQLTDFQKTGYLNFLQNIQDNTVKIDFQAHSNKANKSIVVELELIHILNTFYISKNNSIATPKTNPATEKKGFSLKLFSAKSDSAKTNVKLELAKNTVSKLKDLENSNLLSEEEKNTKIFSIINELYLTYKDDNDDFAKAVRYLFQYMENISKPAPITKLDKDSEEFKNISEHFIKDAQSFMKKAKRFDYGIVGKTGGSLFKATSKVPPEFGGEDELLFIQKIECLNNVSLQQQYQRNKEATPLINQDELLNIGLDIGSLTEGLDKNKNEIFLYHGTSSHTAHKIVENGFNCEKFCSHNTLRGYGPLGRGTYFTDQLPKAGIYSQCALCGEHRCSCKTMQGFPIPKTTLICKITLGKPELILKKDNQIIHMKNPKEDYHSRIALSKKLKTESDFDSNEFAVSNDAAICPQYIVFYHHYKNTLKPNVWLEEIKKAKFPLEEKSIQNLTFLIKGYDLLKQISGNQEHQIAILIEIQRAASKELEKSTIAPEQHLCISLLRDLTKHVLNQLAGTEISLENLISIEDQCTFSASSKMGL